MRETADDTLQPGSGMNERAPRAARALWWAGVICALAVSCYAAATRLAGFADWQADRARHFVDGRPVMTTPDAYYALRWAGALVDGSYVSHADDPLRHYQRIQYPRGTALLWRGDAKETWMPQRQPRHLPLLSRLIALATPWAGSVERAALWLTPVLAALFVLPLYGYCARLGEQAAGLLAGLVTSAAPIYWSRTGLGDVDTDCLNLFFPWLAALTMLCIRSTDTTRRVLVLSALLGVVLYGYYCWYDKPAIALMYWASLALYLFVQRRGPVLVVAAVVLCVLASHPVQLALCATDVQTLVTRYLGGSNPADGLSLATAWFPQMMDTIVEFRSKGWQASLEGVLAPLVLPVLGLLAFALFAVRRWRDCVPLLPLLAIGSFTFISGPRFAMYLPPFAGLGLGLLLSWGVRRVLSPSRTTTPDWRHQSLTAALAVLLFATCLQPLAASHAMPRTIAMPTALHRALQQAAERMPPTAPVWTWWDYGFALEHLFGFSVYHDGAAQYTPQTHVIAASLIDDDQTALSRTMDFVDAFGNRGLDALARETGSRDALLQALATADVPAASRRPKYVLFTQNMLDAASALRYAAGAPTETPAGASIYFEPLPCRDLSEHTLHCDGFDIDLRAGSFSDGRRVRRFVIVDGGQVVRALDYANASAAVVELIIGHDRKIRTYRVPDALYRSNLNRMYVLGDYDPALFEEVWLAAGTLRMFRQRF